MKCGRSREASPELVPAKKIKLTPSRDWDNLFQDEIFTFPSEVELEVEVGTEKVVEDGELLDECQVKAAVASIKLIMDSESKEKEAAERKKLEEQKKVMEDPFSSSMGMVRNFPLEGYRYPVSYEDLTAEEDSDYEELASNVIWDPDLFAMQAEVCSEDRNEDDQVVFQKVEAARKVRREEPKTEQVSEDDSVYTKPPPSPTDKDFYNIGNDQYYENPSIYQNTGVADAKTIFQTSTLVHSKPIREFQPPFIKLPWIERDLRNFHRPNFANRRRFPIPALEPGPGLRHHRIFSLTKRINSKAKERESLQLQQGWIGIDKPIDTSGRDGEIVLVEYSEEYPSLLSQIGMASRIVNYFVTENPTKETLRHAASMELGENKLVEALPPPYMGKLNEGETFSGLENNMALSPIYHYCLPETDFLIVISAKAFMIRGDVQHVYTAGQQCPLIKVPKPGSQYAKDIFQNILWAWTICELNKEKLRLSLQLKSKKFQKTNRNTATTSPTVPFYKIQRAFPNMPEKYLKECLSCNVDFSKSKKNEEEMIQIKKGFALPEVSDLDKICPPEQYCAYASMLASEQHLRDTFALNNVTALTKEERENEDLVNELQAAPWNTTSAFLDTLDGKCFFEVNGSADPTGRGEGFSLVRVPIPGQGGGRSSAEKELKMKPFYHATRHHKLFGTNLDLSTVNAVPGRSLLRKMGIPMSELKPLGRNEVKNLLETLSLLKIEIGKKDDRVAAIFDEWKNQKAPELTEDYFKNEVQRIFELQNKMLGSMSTFSHQDNVANNKNIDDDDDSEDTESEESWDTDDDSDELSDQELEDLGRQLELMLGYEGMVGLEDKETKLKKSDRQKEEFEQEEKGRQELIQSMMPSTRKMVDDEVNKELNNNVPTPKLGLQLKKKEEKGGRWEDEKKVAKEALTTFVKSFGDDRKPFLKLIRTVKMADGGEVKKEQIVRDPAVIKMYLRLRSEKDPKYLRGFSKVGKRNDKLEKEDKIREAMKKVEQLKKEQEERETRDLNEGLRLKLKLHNEYFPTDTERKKARQELKALGNWKKLRCRKCALYGHASQTSKECPFFDVEEEEESQALAKIKKEATQRKRKQTLEAKKAFTGARKQIGKRI